MTSAVLHRTLLALLVLAGAAFVIDLGGSTIWDANEAFYAETPREMIERGDYVNPTFNYEPRINKPVLSYWIVAGLYNVFGVSVTTERLAIAAAALAMIAAACFLGRAASRYATVPLLAALGLAANPRFFMFGRRILVDVLLAAFMTLTLVLFALAERYPARRRLFLLLMYVCAGLGALTKGPVAIALPALVFLIYLAMHGELRRITTMLLPAGAVIVLAIVAPWYVALYGDNGWSPIASFFIGENLERYTANLGIARGPLFYIPVVFSDGLPWSLLLPAAIAAWLGERRTTTVSVDPQRRIRTLLLIWIGVFVAFFSFSGTKQDLYILPIVSAVAVLGADALARGAIEGGLVPSRSVRWGLILSGAVLAAAGAIVLYVFGRAGAAYALNGTTVLGIVGIAGGLAAMALASRRAALATVVLVAAFVLVNWTLLLRVLPSFERYKPVAPLTDVIRAKASPDAVIVHYGVAMPSMVFYLQRRIDVAFSRDQFLHFAQGDRPVFGVMPQDVFEDLRPDLAPSTCVLATQPTFDAKLKLMLSGRAPTPVVAISTRCDR